MSAAKSILFSLPSLSFISSSLPLAGSEYRNWCWLTMMLWRPLTLIDRCCFLVGMWGGGRWRLGRRDYRGTTSAPVSGSTVHLFYSRLSYIHSIPINPFLKSITIFYYVASFPGSQHEPGNEATSRLLELCMMLVFFSGFC